MSKPLVVDLYCGLGGWAEGFLAEGYDVVGFDIERHDYGTGGYPGQLVLQDALTLHGSQFKDATVIVASPPCQKYSYMAMPWSKAKALIKHYEASPENRAELAALFDACFRIQREASEAAGRHIPMVVENVRGAQRWVGRAKANYGSFFLWGDVGMVGRRVVAGPSLEYGQGVSPVRGRMKANPDGTAHPVGSWFAVADSKERGAHTKNNGGSWFAVAHNTESGRSQNPVHALSATGVKAGGVPISKVGFNVACVRKLAHGDSNMSMEEGRKTVGHVNQRDGHTHARHLTNQAESDGVKGFTPNGEPLEKNVLGRMHGSKSPARKAASAAIAKIPFPLASYIARAFRNR